MPEVYRDTKGDKTRLNRETVVERLAKERTDKELTAYAVRPRRVKFETQEKKEKIVLLLRRHWLTNVGWVLVAVLMVLAPLGLKFLPLLTFLPGRFQVMTVVMWYLMTMGFVFEKFLSWFFNVNIVTDERIIDVDFISLIYKVVSECKIERIQDITYRTGGAIRSLFNFGDVIIQTAGELPQFVFEAVPRPQEVAKILNELILEEEQERLEGRAR